MNLFMAKYSEIIKGLKPEPEPYEGAIGVEEAKKRIGGEAMYRLALKAGLLIPVVKRNRLTLYDYKKTIECWKLICQIGDKGLEKMIYEKNKERKNAIC